jgi:hypothetical protein
MKECIISYYEKKLMDDSYIYGDEPTHHPSMSFYIGKSMPAVTIITSILIIALFIYNLFIMIQNVGLPSSVATTGAVGAALFFGYWRYVDYCRMNE